MPQRHEQSDNILVRLTGKQVYLAKRRLIDEGNSLLRNFSIEIRKREADSRGLPSARLILVTFICATVTISERRFDKEKHDSARKQGEETRKNESNGIIGSNYKKVVSFELPTRTLVVIKVY